MITEINSDDIQLLWVNDWYDGPLEGMCHLKNESHLENTMYYFKMSGGDEDKGDWHYNLYQLTDDQLRQEICRHGEFVQHVGDYWTINPDGTQGTYKPKEEHAKYYDANHPDLVLTDEQIIGRTKNL